MNIYSLLIPNHFTTYYYIFIRVYSILQTVYYMNIYSLLIPNHFTTYYYISIRVYSIL